MLKTESFKIIKWIIYLNWDTCFLSLKYCRQNKSDLETSARDKSWSKPDKKLIK